LLGIAFQVKGQGHNIYLYRKSVSTVYPTSSYVIHQLQPIGSFQVKVNITINKKDQFLHNIMSSLGSILLKIKRSKEIV